MHTHFIWPKKSVQQLYPICSKCVDQNSKIQTMRNELCGFLKDNYPTWVKMRS